MFRAFFVSLKKNLARAARDINCTVRVPYEEVHSKNLIEGVSDSVQSGKICIEAIMQGDCLVVDLDERVSRDFVAIRDNRATSNCF
jgi:hypothetical protein